MKNRLLTGIVCVSCFASSFCFGDESGMERMWLEQLAKACSVPVDVSAAENWDQSQRNRFIKNIPLNALLDAIESMPSNNDQWFYEIKRELVSTIVERPVPAPDRSVVFSRIESVASRWDKQGSGSDGSVYRDFGSYLHNIVTILKARYMGNQILDRWATNTFKGVYVDLDRIHIRSTPLPEDIGREMIKSIAPIEETCWKGYAASAWWRAQPRFSYQIENDQFPVKREKEKAVRAFFQVSGGGCELTFLLAEADDCTDTDIGLVVPVTGDLLNILFIIRTKPTHDAVAKAVEFVRKNGQ